jgi:hypothetical protein
MRSSRPHAVQIVEVITHRRQIPINELRIPIPTSSRDGVVIFVSTPVRSTHW